MIWAVIAIGVILVVVLQRTSAEKALQALEADRRPDSLLAESEVPTSVSVTLENRSRKFIPFASVSCQLSFALEAGFSFSTWLLPQQQVQRSFPITVSKRGRFVLEEMQISCGDFLGLKEEKKRSGSFQEIIVPPKPLDVLLLDTLVGGFLGDISARRFILEDPVLTLGFREYTGCEPMKRISWTQSARHNTLLVKKHDYTMDPSVSVMLNVETDLQEPEAALEACFSAARSVCAVLEEKGIRYSFSTNALLLGRKHDNSGISGLGQRHFGAILEVLGRASGSTVLSLETLLEKELQQPGFHGRILITPGGNELNTRLSGRLQEAGGLLIIRGREVAP